MIHVCLNVNPPNHHHQYIKENEEACIQGLKSHIFHCVIKSLDPLIKSYLGNATALTLHFIISLVGTLLVIKFIICFYALKILIYLLKYLEAN